MSNPMFTVLIDEPIAMDIGYDIMRLLLRSNTDSRLTEFVIVDHLSDPESQIAVEFFKRYDSTIQSVVGLDQAIYFPHIDELAEHPEDFIKGEYVVTVRGPQLETGWDRLLANNLKNLGEPSDDRTPVYGIGIKEVMTREEYIKNL